VFAGSSPITFTCRYRRRLGGLPPRGRLRNSSARQRPHNPAANRPQESYTRRQSDELCSTGSEECIRGNEQGVGALGKAGKGCIDPSYCRRFKNSDLQPYRAGGLLRPPQRALGALTTLPGLTSTAIRTALGSRSCRSRSRLPSTSLRKSLTPVAFPPGRAKLATRWDLGDTEDNRNRRSCSFGGKGRSVIAARCDHGDLSADQVGHECRQAIVLARYPMVLDRYVMTIDVARFVEAFVKGSRSTRFGIRRPAANDPDHRQRRLLSARGERPCGYTAKNRDEVPSPHGPLPLGQALHPTTSFVRQAARFAARQICPGHVGWGSKTEFAAPQQRPLHPSQQTFADVLRRAPSCQLAQCVNKTAVT
jgi:hypothetical protein